MPAIPVIDFPKVRVNFERDCSCGRWLKTWNSYIGKYVEHEDQHHDKVRNYIVSAGLHVRSHGSFHHYVQACRKKYKGNVMRDASKAADYRIDQFIPSEYVNDIVEINHSMNIRSGGPMRGHYTYSAEDLVKDPPEYMSFDGKTLPCGHHWIIPMGIFDYKKLIGYIIMKRVGDMLLYNQILGHGDYLKFGIMYALHFEIMRQLYDSGGHMRDIRVILYGGWFDGTEGLQLWKKKTLFKPMFLVTR